MATAMANPKVVILTINTIKTVTTTTNTTISEVEMVAMEAKATTMKRESIAKGTRQSHVLT